MGIEKIRMFLIELPIVFPIVLPIVLPYCSAIALFGFPFVCASEKVEAGLSLRGAAADARLGAAASAFSEAQTNGKSNRPIQ